jgi:hypothetical protein
MQVLARNLNRSSARSLTVLPPDYLEFGIIAVRLSSTGEK